MNKQRVEIQLDYALKIIKEAGGQSKPVFRSSMRVTFPRSDAMKRVWDKLSVGHNVTMHTLGNYAFDMRVE